MRDLFILTRRFLAVICLIFLCACGKHHSSETRIQEAQEALARGNSQKAIDILNPIQASSLKARLMIAQAHALAAGMNKDSLIERIQGLEGILKRCQESSLIDTFKAVANLSWKIDERQHQALAEALRSYKKLVREVKDPKISKRFHFHLGALYLWRAQVGLREFATGTVVGIEKAVKEGVNSVNWQALLKIGGHAMMDVFRAVSYLIESYDKVRAQLDKLKSSLMSVANSSLAKSLHLDFKDFASLSTYLDDILSELRQENIAEL